MACQFHGLVQNPANDDHVGLQAVDQKMPGMPHDPEFGAAVLPTQTQVPGAYCGAEFGTFETARTVRLRSDIA